MFFRSKNSRREQHWKRTEATLVDELISRAQLIRDPEFRVWVASFIGATQHMLKSIFLDGIQGLNEFTDRLESLTKESFLSIHSVFLIQHLAICRDSVDDLERAIYELAKVLSSTPSQIQVQVSAYDGLDGMSISLHLNRQISRILGLSEVNVLHAFIWSKAIVQIAQTAVKLGPEVAGILDKYRTSEPEY